MTPNCSRRRGPRGEPTLSFSLSLNLHLLNAFAPPVAEAMRQVLLSYDSEPWPIAIEASPTRPPLKAGIA
jgi:hypothetical protein